MAIVASGIAPTGARYRVFDDAYANISPEEMQRRRDRINRVVHAILTDYARRESAEAGAAPGGASKTHGTEDQTQYRE